MTNELDTKIKSLALEYWNEFSDSTVDGVWSGTAYEDLGSLKDELNWSEFHFALETAVKEIDTEIGIDEDAAVETTDAPYIFLEQNDTDNPNREILVGKTEWFSEVPACEIRNSFGGVEGCESKDENGGECCCADVTAYEYWDGSNHQHIVIDAPWGSNYSIVDDEAEIAELTDVVRKAKSDDSYPFEEAGTGYRACTIGEYKVTESSWQGAWEIYTITEADED